MARVKLIALEEHYWTPAIRDANLRLGEGHSAPLPDRFAVLLEDVGDERLAAMDAAGVDMQVLSQTSPATQRLPPDQAVPLARDANDELARTIARTPDRLQGFATLPVTDPSAAAAELTRSVVDLGLRGAMLHGASGGVFLDDLRFDPILRAASDLDVPIYLHPVEPLPAVREAYYGELPGADASTSALLHHMFATSGWGWHVETGTHALRMILGGVFDRHPTLQIILGHWGELVPFYLARADGVLSPLAKHLDRRVAAYFTQNFHVTPGGLETVAPLRLCLEVLGVDRIMYSADYPYSSGRTQGRRFLDGAPLSDDERAKISHLNAEKLLKLQR
jgi:predicted TIM-barrel fold metal-dependent hydrolase